MVLPEIEEILIKYKTKEEKIDGILRLGKNSTPSGPETEKVDCTHKSLSLDEAKKRNQQLLKEIEFVKGNLRSKSIFSPTELQWQKICQEYRNEPALPVKTWRCHLPVYV